MKNEESIYILIFFQFFYCLSAYTNEDYLIQFSRVKSQQFRLLNTQGKAITNNAISVQTFPTDEVKPEGNFSILEIYWIIITSWIDTSTNSNKKFM